MSDQICALLSPSQAARLLDLHPNSVRRLAAQGKLPSQRVGWSRVFALQDVQRFAESRRRRKACSAGNPERLRLAAHSPE
jgi:excisionase family DNA binding protein